jgi:hypothetical protein
VDHNKPTDDDDMGLKAERRIKERKVVDAIEVTELTSLDKYKVIAQNAVIIDASPKGFLLQVDRKDLVQENLKKNLTLESLVGESVVMFLPQMNLDLDGTIRRTQHKGKGFFQIAVDFSDNVPDYWKECLIDLLPEPGEIDG